MNNLLNAENLIEVHQELNDFAKYHHNKGGQEAHQLIKKTFIDSMKDIPMDGSGVGVAIDKAKDRLLKQILALLHETFVP